MGISSVAEIADRFAATAEKLNNPEHLVRQSSTSSESFVSKNHKTFEIIFF